MNTRYHSLIFAGSLLLFLILSTPGWGITISSYSAAVNNRFASGFNTESPVMNTDSSFVGAGYDWSGVGWNASPGAGSNVPEWSRVQNFVMLSPIAAYSASHYSLTEAKDWNSDRTQVRLVNNAGQVIHATLSGATIAPVSPNTDHRITKLTQPLAASAGISTLRVLDIASGNYVGQPLLMVGSVIPSTVSFSAGQLVATSQVSFFANGGTIFLPKTNFADSQFSFTQFQSGDSGSPVLITYKGQLTILGEVTSSGGSGSSILTSTSSSAMNTVLAADGYALKWLIYDVPTDTANTANRWTGGAGLDAFGATGNWSKGAVPTSQPVVFDAGAANGQTTVTLGADQNLRGILFATNTASTGFTFAAGNVLTVGATGIRNEDVKTQTFNNAIVLGGSQNWEAVNGDMVFNGGISNTSTNSYLVVVGGARNTTISGVISGAGALAKDDEGTLYLSGNNLYTGKTMLHHGTIRIGATNALPTGTAVTFDAPNPTATLDLNGRSVTVGELSSDIAKGGTGIVALNGGSLTTGGAAASSSTYAGVFTGTGNVTKLGTSVWNLTGNHADYSGTFLLQRGVVYLYGTLGGGANTVQLTVSNGATLVGSGGTVNGSIILNSTASLYIMGASITDLEITDGMTWNGGAKLGLHLGASAGISDLIDISNGFLQKGTAGTYLINFLGSSGALEGDYTLMKFGGTDFVASDFSYSGITGYSSSYFSIDNNTLVFHLQSVPEPSARMLCTLGMTFLTMAAIRRQSRQATSS